LDCLHRVCSWIYRFSLAMSKELARHFRNICHSSGEKPAVAARIFVASSTLGSAGSGGFPAGSFKRGKWVKAQFDNFSPK
jgi:hypothetical protein